MESLTWLFNWLVFYLLFCMDMKLGLSQWAKNIKLRMVKVKVKLSLCHAMRRIHYLSTTPWRRRGSGGIALCILNLDTRWRSVVNFTSQPFYPWGKSPWYPLDRRLGRHHSLSGRGGKEKKIPSPAGNRIPVVQPGSGAHPASHAMGTRGSFLGGKAAGACSWPLTSI